MLTLPTAKKLYEKGVRIEDSFWVWINPVYSTKFYEERNKELDPQLSYSERMGTIEVENPETQFLMNRGNLICYKDDEDKKWNIIPAPSVEELLAILPAYVKDCVLVITKRSLDFSMWEVSYPTIYMASDWKSLPEVLAKMIIYLIDELGYHYSQENNSICK